MSSYFRRFVEITPWQAEESSVVWYLAQWNNRYFRRGSVDLCCGFANQETKIIVNLCCLNVGVCSTAQAIVATLNQFIEKHGFDCYEAYGSCYCCDRKSRAACAQSFTTWQQATIEIMLAISLTIACSRYIYNGVILHAHPVRGESHNQRNATEEISTLLMELSGKSKTFPLTVFQPVFWGFVGHRPRLFWNDQKK